MFKKSGKASRDKKQRDRQPNDFANMLGLGGPMMPDDDDDEESLEAELAALQGRPLAKKKKDKGNEKQMSMSEIAKLADASLRDVDEDVSDDGLEDDEDLMGELNDIIDEDGSDDKSTSASDTKQESPAKSLLPSSGSSHVLEERKNMYTLAIQSAKAEGANSKVRRFERGLKEIEKLLKDARAGKQISDDDIPPPVAVKGSGSGYQSQPVQDSSPKPAGTEVAQQQPGKAHSTAGNSMEQGSSPRQHTHQEASKPDSGTLSMLNDRKNAYKAAALQKKREGDVASAKQLLGVAKRFESVISSLESGQEVDLNDIPPPPGELLAAAASAVKSKHVEPTEPSPSAASSSQAENIPTAPGGNTSSEPASLPPQPTTVLEALQQRFEKYEKSAEQAKAEGNGSKARRMTRIAKQYQDAIKAHKAGRPVDYEDLPTPPGFGPIPGVKTAADSEDPTAAAAALLAAPVDGDSAKSNSEVQQSSAATTGPQAQVAKPLSRNEKELQFLLQRQKDLKTDALKAKRAGDINSAKEYLRQAKGLDDMIVSAQNGLRVDVSSVPRYIPYEGAKAPTVASHGADSLGNDYVVVTGEDAEQNASSGNSNEVYGRLEQALKNQIETSTKNAEHYRLLGDLTTAQNFLSLQKSSQQDLDTLRVSRAHGEPVPKFHYENKSFPVVRSHPNLSDSEAEITILRCINIPLPQGYQAKDMSVYVNYEFPFPSDSPQTGYSESVKNTINPEYNFTFKVNIDRKSRAMSRVFKRQGMNFTVMYYRGFLKSDKALGQANLKLDKLANKCKIHECIDLVDPERGRKAVGGKIEVMVKLREPLVDKDAEIIEERWLVLDSHLRTLQIRAKSAYGGQRPNVAAESYESLEVLKLEKELAEKQIGSYKSQGKTPPPKLMEELKSCIAKSRALQEKLKSGGVAGLKVYLRQLESGLDIEKAKAQDLLKQGDKTGAKLCLAKKKLLDKEITALKQRVG